MQLTTSRPNHFADWNKMKGGMLVCIEAALKRVTLRVYSEIFLRRNQQPPV